MSGDVTAWLERWRDGELGVNDRVRRVAVERFSREALAGRLADVLDAAIEEAGD